MNTPNTFVVKERYRGKWINTYFDNKEKAKRLCMKIIARGGQSVWMKNAH